MVETLLPPNATQLERSIEAVNAAIEDIPVPIDTVLDPWRCPAALLPWLAWAFSVDTWDSSWSERTKREVIAASYQVHRTKGSVHSVKLAIEAATGQTPVILENLHRPRRDGSCRRNGHYWRGWQDAWPLYRVILTRPIRNDQAEAVLSILETTAPARSKLASIDYSQVAILRDGQASRNGDYNRGVFSA